MNFKNEIDQLIKSNLKTYRDTSDRFIADYNRELELTKEYNGRQLLELLQNSDDALSNEVLIEWHKEDLKLIISDKGDAFTVGGIKSLMLANLSTKTRISYIGNKGLGFRSILNWAEHIDIYSNSCKISFSEAIAKEVFYNDLNLSDTDRFNLREERNLSHEAVPFPTLAVPKVEEDIRITEWTTSIEITCKKEFEIKIEDQLNDIREEILLFLNNIQKITIRNTEGETKEFGSDKMKEDGFETVKIKNKSWKVFTRDNPLPSEYQDKTKNEKQSYSLKIAFQDDLSDTYHKLFNFFPTQLSLSLPCIIHGTFELNSSRNYLNESRKNEYILKELVQLFRDCALFLTNENIDWRPYKLLSPLTNRSDSKLIETFYNDLETLKKEETIYPCVNNQYRSFKYGFYYSDAFNSFFKENFPTTLPQLLFPLENEVNNIFQNSKPKNDYLIERIDKLSFTNISISLRAELIVQLTKVISFKEEQARFSLLINESDKVISKEDLAFTPVVRSEESFNIPKSVKVDFMKSELYDLLVSKFENSFDKKEPKPRELQRSIKSIVNLQPYDSNNVIDKIITGTKEALKGLNNNEEKATCIKEMVAALFVNFKNIENRQEKLKISIPIISKTNMISNAEDLFLSKTFPSGKITEVIYGNKLKANEYLANIDYWNLENEELNLVESFFLWLGVNKYSKIELINLQNNWIEKNYIDFIFNNGIDKPDNFEISRIQKSIVYRIDKFDEIIQLPINNLILLVLKDSFIRKQLEGNEERISWYYVTWRPTIISNYSYLRYQFIKSGLFSKFILEDGSEEFNNLINEDFQIDYDFLSQFEINKSEVKAILVKLGAKESFNELAPNNIYDILQIIPENDLEKEGKATQKIYKLALDSLVKQESNIQVPDNIKFFAKKGDIEDYQPANKIYYSDNTILPRKVLDTLFLINLPKRSGEDNVEKYFGVESLKKFKIQITDNSIKENPCNTEFNSFFEAIKPYLLAYRIESPNLKKRISDTETKRKEAKSLKQCRVNIVNECRYTYGEKENVSIEEKEYINVNDEFYFKINSLNSAESLKKDSIFCDAFAEMMCVVFKVNTLKNDFRQILKNELTDTIHLAVQDLGKEKIEEAFRLLGISRVEIDFWKNVFLLKGEKLLEPVENSEVLKFKTQESLGIRLSDGYSKVDFENFYNKESFELIKLLNDELSLSVQQIFQKGLYSWHKIQFVNAIKDLKFKFEQLIWNKLNDSPKEQSEFISILNNYNLSFIDSIESEIQSVKYDLNVDYSTKLKSLITHHFNINIDDELSQNMIIENLYIQLLNSYSVEEVDILEETIRSLLFFKDNSDTIESYLKHHFVSSKDGDSTKDSDESNGTGSLIDASLSKNNKVTSNITSGNGNGSWVHSGQSDRSKKRKGKKAELLAYNTLVKEYGIENVKWVSGNSTTPDKNDKLHYDIEYKNEEGDWKYLEVKAMSDNQFIISRPEIEKGMTEPDKFEMALVCEDTIYMVKDIFKFNQGESFENNSKFVAFSKDYIFSFNLNT